MTTYYRVDLTGSAVQVSEYRLVRKTPAGAWILLAYELGNPHLSENEIKKRWPNALKWVADGEGKRFAYPTLEQAIESFYRRQKRRRAILIAQLSMVDAALAEREKSLKQLRQWGYVALTREAVQVVGY